ncbi:MAG: DUF1598 domain-containing protein, partial [Planctomycetes bacterium]|nr:DUF1598 domain-containing protein [Planctomycetota bacterium]
MIGFVPAAGSGAVGGVSVDAQGVLARAKSDEAGDLRQARLAALRVDSTEITQPSPLRKISLRRLEAAIAEHRRLGQPLPDEMQVLAGMQRLQYVFAFPEHEDIILAGRAEGWRIDDQGNYVGATTARPVLQLADLIVALRAAEAAAVTGVSCSIEPSAEGVGRLQRLMRQPGLRMSQTFSRGAEQAVGPQTIRVKGVSDTSRFARVMIAADFLMKRLAMNLERPPVEGLPSYLELVRRDKRRLPRNSLPRWWMTPHYESVVKSPDSLAWELCGSSVRALSEESLITEFGGLASSGKAHPVAEQWAANFTSRFESLSAAIPVFAELQNLMDLSVVAALLAQQNLSSRCNCPLSLMLNPAEVRLASYPAARQIDSQASFVSKGNEWVLAVSGGV